MATKRLRTTRGIIPAVSPGQLFYLSDELIGEYSRTDGIRMRFFKPDIVPATWADCREEILRAYAEQAPGTRPLVWWRLDAPETARRRLGGIGDPASDHLNYAPWNKYGIPVTWIDPDMVSYYGRNGRFTGKAIDPNDPPTFESQAAYLKRHGLFLPGEEKRLPADAYEPETINPEE